MLAREAEHRAKNVLATVQATVHLSKADTPDALKRVIEGRIGPRKRPWLSRIGRRGPSQFDQGRTCRILE